jgi:hypothetical protein
MHTPEEKNYKNLLYDLLCIVHRDGGHYIDEYGFDRAYFDAVRIFLSMSSVDYRNNFILNKIYHAIAGDMCR